MSTSSDQPEYDDQSDDKNEPYHQQVQHQSVSARLPESFGGGVFCTSSLIVESNDTFLIDFVNGSAPPARLVARVIMTPRTMQQFMGALNQSCERARKARAGGEGKQPDEAAETASIIAGAGQTSSGDSGQSTQPPKSVEDIYGELKLTDEVLCGSFSNTAIIRHSQDEVVLDFISNYFPRAVVTCRVTMATTRIERFRRSVEDAFRKYEEKRRGY